MKVFFTLCIALIFAFTLTGCIGENYDFSPPTVSLENPDEVYENIELAEANIDWDWHSDEYNKKTDDIQALAKKQVTIHFNSGQKVDYTLEDGHFDSDGVSVSVWQNDSETKLKLEEVQSFYLPEETGEYVIVFDLSTSKGNAQYVGNILIE